MATWKPVKPLNGPTSQGRQHAYQLDKIDAPFLKRRNGDGSISYKKNGVLFAKAAEPEELIDDGYYCLGRVGSEYRIMGSRTARGKFKDRGPAGGGSFSSANLQFYGRGKGFDIESESDTMGFANFDGVAYPFAYTTTYTTRNGKSMKPRHTFVDANIAGGTAPRLHAQTSVPFSGGAWTILKDGAHVPRVYFVGMQVSGGQHVPKLYADPTEKYGDVEALPTIHIPGQLCGTPTVHLPDLKGKLLLVNRYLRPTYSGSSANPLFCPGIAFTISNDHGQTWADMVTDGMFGDSQSLNFLTAGMAFKYNEAVRATLLNLFCTDPVNSRGIAIATVPVALFISGVWTVRYRRKVGRYDGFTITENVLLGEDADYGGAEVMADYPTPLVLNGVQGVAYLNRYASPVGLIPSTRPTLMWTDGLTTTTLGIMPFINAYTGGMVGVGPGKLVCSMYDGEYSLYELTTDMTWTKRATINDVAAAPLAGNWTLRNFHRLTYLRKDGAPVSATPSAPWMSNSRRLPPT